MRGIHIDEVDHLDRDVLAIATTYPSGHLLPAHRHRRAQFLYGATGSMRVETAHGTWTVPPQRAVLVPPDTEHAVRMDGVSTRSLYLAPRAVPWFPARCRVVDVGPMLRELLLAATDIEPLHPRRGRDAALLALAVHEVRRSAPLPLDLPLPTDPQLRAACLDFLQAPRIDVTPQQWARRLGISTRTLHRRFTADVGVALAAWRRRACVLHSLPQLAARRPVSDIATDLGYASPAAFTTMFHRTLGGPPSAYRGTDPSPTAPTTPPPRQP